MTLLRHLVQRTLHPESGLAPLVGNPFASPLAELTPPQSSAAIEHLPHAEPVHDPSVPVAVLDTNAVTRAGRPRPAARRSLASEKRGEKPIRQHESANRGSAQPLDASAAYPATLDHRAYAAQPSSELEHEGVASVQPSEVWLAPSLHSLSSGPPAPRAQTRNVAPQRPRRELTAEPLAAGGAEAASPTHGVARDPVADDGMPSVNHQIVLHASLDPAPAATRASRSAEASSSGLPRPRSAAQSLGYEPSRRGLERETSVHVSIGRVEVRAHAPAAPMRSAAPAPAKQHRLSLNSYLEQRRDGKR